MASNKKNKKAKKDAQLVLRLDRELRDKFVDTCQELDTTAAPGNTTFCETIHQAL